MTLHNPVGWLLPRSRTYERWRADLVVWLGAKSSIIEASKLYTRERFILTWAKGERLAHIVGIWRARGLS